MTALIKHCNKTTLACYIYRNEQHKQPKTPLGLADGETGKT